MNILCLSYVTYRIYMYFLETIGSMGMSGAAYGPLWLEYWTWIGLMCTMYHVPFHSLIISVWLKWRTEYLTRHLATRKCDISAFVFLTEMLKGNGGMITSDCLETPLQQHYFIKHFYDNIIFAMLYCACVLAGTLSPRFATLLRDLAWMGGKWRKQNIKMHRQSGLTAAEGFTCNP